MDKNNMKVDRYFISKEPHEIYHVINKMEKEGRQITKEQIFEAMKLVGNGRRKIYKHLRSATA